MPFVQYLIITSKIIRFRFISESIVIHKPSSNKMPLLPNLKFLSKICHVTCRPCFPSLSQARQLLFHTIMAGASGVGLDAESSRTASVRKKRKGPANAVAGPSTSRAEEVPNLRGRRKIGLLAGLPNLPLDVLFEVNLKSLLLELSHLHVRSWVIWILTTF